MTGLFSACVLSTQRPAMQTNPDPAPRFTVRDARSEAERMAAYRLRHRVFVEELGGVSRGDGVERDRFDAHCAQLILIDQEAPDPEARIVGTYRVLDAEGARAAGGFYSEGEYDLGPLLRSGRPLLEFGRSCVLPDYRGGAAMHAMWAHILRMVRARRVELLFGVASFHGTDVAALAAPLSILHQRHLAPSAIRPVARGPEAVAMDLTPPEALDRKAAMRAMPALIKAYLRLGTLVGEGAWVDRDFNTTDVCLVLDMARMNPAQARLYEREAG